MPTIEELGAQRGQRNMPKFPQLLCIERFRIAVGEEQGEDAYI